MAVGCLTASGPKLREAFWVFPLANGWLKVCVFPAPLRQRKPFHCRCSAFRAACSRSSMLLCGGAHSAGALHASTHKTNTGAEEVMSMSGFSRRTFLQGSVGLTVANFVPGTTPFASAATMEEQTTTASKAAAKADDNAMIWSPSLVPMKPVIAEFTKETGIGIGAVQDISIFEAPKRAITEAVSHSPQV